ncbi:MAG: hypothetical protein M3R17_02150 [Bacteroidota bacterium]|nr:hypothetical protein [Bacteroidota bacterium]
MFPLLLFSLLVFTGGLFAQPVAGGEFVGPDASYSGRDTAEIPEGVIYVRKSAIIPYVKIEYKYYLSQVHTVEVLVPVDNGIDGNVERKRVPVFDSSHYSPKLERVYPKEHGLLLSKMFIENMTYRYNENDTPRVDTMVIGMWIDKKGGVKQVLDDPEYTLQMPDQMVKELTWASQSVKEWGAAGGYYEKKKFLRKAPLIFESYYCEVFVIVSSYPLTVEQKLTRYAPFDYPLNSPPLDEQQKASGEKNAAVPKPR